MKRIAGDLIKRAKEGDFDVIVHGCNCFCTMGAGIAYAIALEFPEAAEADQRTKRGDKNKLGTYTVAMVQRGQNKFLVVNAYIQYGFATKDQPCAVSYGAISQVFEHIAKDFSGLRIAYPMLGAGLAGGDWGVIRETIETKLQGEDHTLVVYQHED